MAKAKLKPIGAHTHKGAKTIGVSYPDDKSKYGYRDRYIPKTAANLKKMNALFKYREFDGKNHIWF